MVVTCTGSSPIQMTLPYFSAKDMSNIQCLSNNNLVRLAKHIRTATSSRTAIEVHLKTDMIAHNHRMDDLFTVWNDSRFLLTDGEEVERPFVYFNNFLNLIYYENSRASKQNVYEHQGMN